ncbi:NAD(P)-dependent oxidoreductase [Krasilnikoviella flava]|uniref:NAD(P)H-binding n=1 Tax=Krasilnikoviella flava TaxID=526729 RepID=A0A1T5M440_9MICO|nr:NAD(P)-binding oxidoreductase [Krasilnikoviella flava]SKC82578.1 NAD(P)H-binding [Krasilnikoviella flava]
MDVLVVGATRGSGLAITRELVAAGHRVTAFGRTASTAFAAPVPGPGSLRPVDGDALDPEAVAKAVAGQDAVVVTLGISDNPLTVQWLRRSSTAPDVRSRGTANVVRAMRETGARRLVVQSTYGLGDSWAHLDLTWKLVFRFVIGRQFTDSGRQEAVVRASGLDWTLVRPVSLTDDAVTGEPAHVTTDDTRRGLKVSRAQLAQVHAASLADPAAVGATLSVSA